MATAGMVVLNLTNAMGETVIACNVIVMRVDGFAMLPNMTFGQAMSVYTGQNVGAGKYDRVHQGVKQGSIIAGSFSTAITLVLLFLSPVLFGFFTSLLIESLQIFTYRATDINDLITNAFGTFLGWILARITLKLVPGWIPGNRIREVYVVCLFAFGVMFFVQPFLADFLFALFH
jgi:Na+-driven multidrug efflux pump